MFSSFSTPGWISQSHSRISGLESLFLIQISSQISNPNGSKFSVEALFNNVKSRRFWALEVAQSTSKLTFHFFIQTFMRKLMSRGFMTKRKQSSSIFSIRSLWVQRIVWTFSESWYLSRLLLWQSGWREKRMQTIGFWWRKQGGGWKGICDLGWPGASGWLDWWSGCLFPEKACVDGFPIVLSMSSSA